MVSSSLCFKSLIISTLRYWIHLKFIVIQLYFFFSSSSSQTAPIYWIIPLSTLVWNFLSTEFLQELGSVSGISVLIHGSATATLRRHSWRELFLSWLSPASPATPPQASFSGPSSTPLLLMASPPALSWCIFPSISQADLIQHHGLNISTTLMAYGLFLWPRPLSWLDVAGCPCSLYLEA